nr:MAG TPA: hypothetical protein [Caudoviricetes sp.]
MQADTKYSFFSGKRLHRSKPNQLHRQPNGDSERISDGGTGAGTMCSRS